MITNEQIHDEVRKLIERVGGKLNNSEDIRIAFSFVQSHLDADVAKLKATAATLKLKEHFGL